MHAPTDWSVTQNSKQHSRPRLNAKRIATHRVRKSSQKEKTGNKDAEERRKRENSSDKINARQGQKKMSSERLELSTFGWPSLLNKLIII
jgi:glutamate synthase domain-containing protein 3